jgi:uncharacterized protein (TIGR04141 family)
MNPKSNKLTVYLVKEKYKRDDAILKSVAGPQIKLDSFTTLYYESSNPEVPGWVDKFFGNKIGTNHKQKMNIAGTQAVLLVHISHKSKKRVFALTFGHGRFMLNDGVIEERFGLKTVLNQITNKEVQNMEKRAMARTPKLIREQLARAGNISDFELDIERDLIESITGKANGSTYGKTITGKDGYSLTAKVDYTNLAPFLQNCLDTYSSDKYRTDFGWIDQISSVSDPALIEKLDIELVNSIKSKSPDVWLGIPAFIEWEGHAGFKYSTRKGDDLLDFPVMADCIAIIGTPSDVDDLKISSITAWDGEDEIKGNWSVYKCIYAEINYKGSAYFLTDGKWYLVANDYVKEVDNYISKNVKWITPSHRAYDNTFADENAYNTYLATTVGGQVLDAKNLRYGGGSSQVEFCDVITPTRQLYFVKKYSSSSVLSHLFSQGFVSGELLAFDQKFRDDVRTTVLPSSLKSLVPASRLKTSDFEIIYFMIQKNLKPNKVRLPFFSKITLRRTHQRLVNYGYTVSFQVVNNTK